mmetsp:Transcript_26035/g.60824  ORF Transcript_26035/g.60824 Transcript_26035/m.60824 type:complete len:216 (+) Transcript_26035:2504-3151(+)
MHADPENGRLGAACLSRPWEWCSCGYALLVTRIVHFWLSRRQMAQASNLKAARRDLGKPQHAHRVRTRRRRFRKWHTCTGSLCSQQRRQQEVGGRHWPACLHHHPQWSRKNCLQCLCWFPSMHWLSVSRWSQCQAPASSVTSRSSQGRLRRCMRLRAHCQVPDLRRLPLAVTVVALLPRVSPELLPQGEMTLKQRGPMGERRCQVPGETSWCGHL